jgi:hypothetical protein
MTARGGKTFYDTLVTTVLDKAAAAAAAANTEAAAAPDAAPAEAEAVQAAEVGLSRQQACGSRLPGCFCLSHKISHDVVRAVPAQLSSPSKI